MIKQPALFPEPVKPKNQFAHDLIFKDIRVKDLPDAVELIRLYSTHETLSYLYSVVDVEKHLSQRTGEMKREILESLEQELFWKETGDLVELNDIFFVDIVKVQCTDIKSFTKMLLSKKLPLTELVRIWEEMACLNRTVTRGNK